MHFIFICLIHSFNLMTRSILVNFQNAEIVTDPGPQEFAKIVQGGFVYQSPTSLQRCILHSYGALSNARG